MVKVLGSFASMPLTRSIMCWPPPSRAAQRLSEGTMSAVVTSVPSVHFSPSRSSKVQVSLSSETPHLLTICGCWLLVAIDAEERVVDHAAGIGRHVRGGPDRVVGGDV